MTIQLTAFYESLQDLKRSYLADLQMLHNYTNAVSAEAPKVHEHILLLKNQLQLMIDTIEEMSKRR